VKGARSDEVKTDKHYRGDVDGLRAVAVIGVLLYHAFPEAMPGGFAGVDVFFVISGFLITRIIISSLLDGTFTFREFYSRRVRRIFPALTLVLAFAVLVGWWALLPDEFRQLGSHILGGVAFVSNLVLWSESGYFDTSANLKPLLHLWSLGVEEQYYLVWPLILFACRSHLRRIFWIILLLAAASFALNLYATTRHPDAAFYWPMPRFWELMLGSIIAYRQTMSGRDDPPSRATAAALSTAGVLLLTASYVLLDPERAFPGWWAMLPTFGAALLIVAGPGGWFNRYVLGSRVAIYIGLISYPLYLWHWPLLTYARIYNHHEVPGAAVRAVMLGASVVLAWMTDEFVEKRVRHLRRTSWSRLVVPALATSMAALGVYGLTAATAMSQSRSAAIPSLGVVSEAFNDWETLRDETIRGSDPRTVLFFGDSHMAQYLPRVRRIALERSRAVRTVRYMTSYGCAALPGIDRPGRNCSDFVDHAFDIARRPEVDTVVIGTSWMGYLSRTDYYRKGEQYDGGAPLNPLAPEAHWVLDGFEARLRDLRTAGKRVVIILSALRGEEFNPLEMVTQDGFDYRLRVPPAVPHSVVTDRNRQMDDWLRQMADRIGATVVDPLSVFCTQQSCPTVDDTGAPLLKDESHLRSSVVAAKFDLLDPFIYL
jgi:peptidoglycan/LPS O-acetylase OafA/YrhL